MKKYSIISLFSGCGGLDLGFVGGFISLNKKYDKNSFEIKWANEIDVNACRSYYSNFNHEIVCEDITKLDFENQSNNLDSKEFPNEIDIILGGFPCQDFSHAGKRKGFEAERGNLYQSMASLIKKTKPKLFVAENVKGLLTMDSGNAIKQIIKDFAKLGYNVQYKLFLTADFGVPQKRERVVIIGTRNDILPDFEFPEPILNKKTWVTLGQALGDLENIEEGKFANHFWSKAKKNNGQGNNLVSENEPGPTMRAEHHGNIEFHWNGKRRLSAREAARIQSFPDDFIFYPSTSAAYKQIGNAVPPVFAWHIAKSIESFLNTNLQTN
jgi:DNA (cytosine-5)-methyltransferase 1